MMKMSRTNAALIVLVILSILHRPAAAVTIDIVPVRQPRQLAGYPPQQHLCQVGRPRLPDRFTFFLDSVRQIPAHVAWSGGTAQFF